MRMVASDYMHQTYRMLGLSGHHKTTDRNWYALRNFHLQYFLDSHICDHYLTYSRDTMTTIWEKLQKSMPLSFKTLSFLCRKFSIIRKLVEYQTHGSLKKLVEQHANGTRNWYLQKKDQRIFAFFKDYETYESIPDWDPEHISKGIEPVQQILEHGYDESKQNLSLPDLQKAALFRGGKCISTDWDGDLYGTLHWVCAFGHEFSSKIGRAHV